MICNKFLAIILTICCCAHNLIVLAFLPHYDGVSSLSVLNNGDQSRLMQNFLKSKLESDDESIVDNKETANEARIDDGRKSDTTERFNYSVNALMGQYDPATTGNDNSERENGNILNAMMKFPTSFTLNVVGRTKGDEESKDEYINQVQDTVKSISGDDDSEFQVSPRGKSFTRISMKVRVESAAVINSIYEELDKMETTVMKY
eukprot:CAMPEP_0194157196 /NCGR_PEP_ID=MMETSP0152-20130528/71044_1 /TAXON_ID=1049557 /ORGANISM="Thalassiothrix antarctica, Strain L6-D1" /LENGTH=203 /DNA_ID=CAMNT_0038865407 /DNA_START=1 /DNA_END=612 /DNA_ORIENTATION=+